MRPRNFSCLPTQALNLDSASAPNPSSMDYGTAINQISNALGTSAPTVLNRSAQYDPSFSGLSQTNLDQMLFGSPGGSTQTQTGTTIDFFDPSTGQTAGAVPQQWVRGPGGMGGSNQPDPGWIQQQTPVYTNTTSPASPGISAIQAQAAQGANQADPMAGQLAGAMGASALANLNQGFNPTPGLSRNISQGLLASNIGSLGGTGDVGAYGQAMGMSQFGQQFYNQNLANAQGAMSSSANFYLPYGQQLTASAMGQANPVTSYFMPNPSLYGDAAMTNYNANAAANITNSNNANALIAAGISSLGSIAGGAAA